MAVPSSRVSAPMNRERRRAPSTLASRPSSSSTAPSRMTLSQTITRARPRQPHRPGEIVRVVRLVGVDEDEVERPASRHQRRQRCRAPARPAGRPRSDSPALSRLRARHVSVVRLEFERHQPAAGRQRARQPDRRIAAERADLEDPLGAAHADQQIEQLALRRRDVDRRQAAGRCWPVSAASSTGSAQEQAFGDVGVDCSPGLSRS